MARVSTKEAGELIKLLVSTTVAQRPERWPSLLTLLIRWATQAAAPQTSTLPARPWERKQTAHQHSQPTPGSAQRQQQQQLLQQASTVVHQALHEIAEQACADPSGSAAAAAALGQLFVPAVLFLSAALTAAQGPLRHQLQPLVVAAACDAAAALAAAPTALLPAAAAGGLGQQAGLPAVLSACKSLLLACKGDANHAAWLIASLLSALHTAVPNILQHNLQQQQQQQQQHHNAVVLVSQSSWLQQQLQDTAVCDTLGLLSGLYSLGHDFGVSCCKHTSTAAPTTQRTAAAAAAHKSSSSSSSKSGWGGDGRQLQGLQAVAEVLAAACTASTDDMLLGLTAAVAAGLCAGILEALPTSPAAAPAVAAATPGYATHQDFTAAADAAWQGAQQQQQQQRGSRPAQPASYRQQLLQHTEVLLSAVEAACSTSCSSTNHSTAAAAAAGGGGSGLPTAAEAAAAAATVGQCQLGQAYGRLWATCEHMFAGSVRPTLAQQQHQRQQQTTVPTLPGLLRTLQYLTNCCCSMAGVLHNAVGCRNAAAANSWLAAQQQQHPAHEVGMLARWLASAAAAAAAVHPPKQQELLQLLAALRASGVQLATSYSNYQMSTPAAAEAAATAAAAGVDAAAVRQQLDRNFAMHVALLSEVWQACKAHTQQQQQQQALSQCQKSMLAAAAQPLPPAAAADGEGDTAASSTEHSAASPAAAFEAAVVASSLADLAALQFCRVQLPAYMDLLRGLVTTLATSSSAADAFIASALPCYEQLVQPHPAAVAVDATRPALAGFVSSSSSSSGQAGGGVGVYNESPVDVVPSAVWLTDTVTAAQLTFLLPLLPVAVRAASNAAATAAQVLPLLLLLLPHPLAAVAQAAHASFAGLVAVAADQQQAQTSSVSPDTSTWLEEDAQPQQQQQWQLMDVVQQTVPMYLQRTLHALPAYGSKEGFATSYYSLLKNMPNGSVMGLLAVNKVADRALELAVQGAAAAAGGRNDSEAGVGSSKPLQLQHAGHNAPVAATLRSAAVGTQGGTRSSGGTSVGPAACADNLLELLELSLQLGDYQLLPAMLEAVSRCVLAAPPSVQRAWLSQLYAGCLAVGDYVRKPALMVWVDGLQKQLRQQGDKAVVAPMKVPCLGDEQVPTRLR